MCHCAAHDAASLLWQFESLHVFNMLSSCIAPPAGNCTYQQVDSLNHKYLHPLLSELVTTPFFRYFKVG